jgi:hypothetical protein
MASRQRAGDAETAARVAEVSDRRDAEGHRCVHHAGRHPLQTLSDARRLEYE